MRLEFPQPGKLIQGLLYLCFPANCAACNRAVSDRNQDFCISCLRQLNPSLMCMQEQNVFTERLFGKGYVHTGAALYLFAKGGPVQKIVHRLKYKNRPDLGKRSGSLLGAMLAQSPHYQDIDMIIPVPLHPKKEKERGYNQSTAIAEGIAETMDRTLENHILIRQTHKGSQTHLGRLERFANVHEVYTVKKPSAVQGKHILLVDDVLTTGATLGTCSDLLLRAGAAKVSGATLAIAL